jgi:hypothetical protein
MGFFEMTRMVVPDDWEKGSDPFSLSTPFPFPLSPLLGRFPPDLWPFREDLRLKAQVAKFVGNSEIYLLLMQYRTAEFDFESL